MESNGKRRTCQPSGAGAVATQGRGRLTDERPHGRTSRRRPNPSQNGTFDRSRCASNPAHGRGPERPGPRCSAGREFVAPAVGWVAHVHASGGGCDPLGIGTSALGHPRQIVRSLTMIVEAILTAGSRSAPVLPECCQYGWMPATEEQAVLALAVGLPRSSERSGSTRLVQPIGTENRVVFDREHPCSLAISWRCGPWQR